MTVLVASDARTSPEPCANERWYGCLFGGRLVSCVVVRADRGGKWRVRAQLRDLSFNPATQLWEAGPFESHDAAYEAGRRAAQRMHIDWHRGSDGNPAQEH